MVRSLMQVVFLFASLQVLSVLLGCGPISTGSDAGAKVTLSPDELTAVKTLSPLPAVPPDPTNRYADDPKAAALGQRLFWDKGLSGPILTGNDGTNGGLGAVGEAGKVACGSCHLAPWLIDPRSKPNTVSLGTNWGPRNSSSMVNIGFYEWWTAGGVNDVLWAFISTSEAPASMNGNRLATVHLVYRKYKDEYNAAFEPRMEAVLEDRARFPAAGKPKADMAAADGPWEMMTAADRDQVNRIWANLGKAMGAYMRRLVSRDAPFDAYVAGDDKALSDAAKRGLKVFLGKGRCVSCHNGPLLSDSKFYNLGVAQTGERVPKTDMGRAGAFPRVLTNPVGSGGPYSDDRTGGRLTGLTAKGSDLGAFRTSTLRQIAETAPYMHTGSLPTLESVVEFYDRGGDADGFVGTKVIAPLSLTAEEKSDLVSFMKTLTGKPVEEGLVRDTSLP